MENLLELIDREITIIESALPNHIYNIMCEREIKTHTQKLKVYDETLNQLMFKLDGSNIDKLIRKEKIIKIQSIQNIIDRSLEKKDNSEVIQISVNQLNDINDTLRTKANEIDYLIKENARLRMENNDLKQTIRMIHNQTTDFVDFTNFTNFNNF
ncbi:BAG domain-containing protein [Fadolivirus algeromassiliense]|jgi:hypothetical protein|uniref:BAG domain-containing protein n=1 Tax=Fadolivirus FV1/VV64 TaxID=3070911 RepID=A0A7D3V613_9VIRU|nr:BAG domain-containing protein [Fadolivirus algeromassiliense]QKF94692.1 BAG domain-containing protein [Fadolivirus FV1/VV64]